MRSQVRLHFIESQFISEPIAIDIDGALGYIQEIGDLFACFAFFDEIGKLDFFGGKISIF